MSDASQDVTSEDHGPIERARSRLSMSVVGFAIGVLLLPWVLVEGFEIIAELININIGGYKGLASLILVYGIVVIGFNLLLGFTGMLSFGHAAFFGTGAYVTGFVSWTVHDPVVAMLGGTVAAILISWPIGFVSIRRSGVYFAVITLTFGQMLYFWALGPGAWITNGDNGFFDFNLGNLLTMFHMEQPVIETLDLVVVEIGLKMYTWKYVFIGVMAIIAIWAANRVIKSPYGLLFRALEQNEQRVTFVGINVQRYKLMAFIISAAFAGVGGALFGIHEQYVHPGTAFFWVTSGDFVIMTILGGAGSLIGPVIGAGIFEYVANVISGVSLPLIGSIGSLWRIVLGAIFVTIIWTMPRGLYPPIRDGISRLVSLATGRGGDDE